MRAGVLIRALALVALLAGPTTAIGQTPTVAPPTGVPPPAGSAPLSPVPAPARPPVFGYEVVNSYPHDPAAFTQGLEFHDGLLIESTGRFPSTIRKVRLETGEVLDRREIDETYFGEGLTVVGDRLLSLTWRNRKGFVWNLDDLTPRGEFAYAGEGWGLTHDASRIILSDGTAALRFFDPETLVETGRVPVTWQGRPIGKLNELEWVEGEVFANVWQSEIIVRIDPATGNIVGVIDLTGLLPASERADPADDVLNGIAWDAESRRLFVTGKNWPRLFEIRLTGPR